MSRSLACTARVAVHRLHRPPARDVIARFGRFLYRNTLLGRLSSAEELAFLQTPGSRF
jgi:uncharacterized protein (DUF924 family)